jgi:hypothetical protein
VLVTVCEHSIKESAYSASAWNIALNYIDVRGCFVISLSGVGDFNSK